MLVIGKFPEWFNKELEQSLLEDLISDSKEAIIRAFESMVIDKTKNLFGVKAFEPNEYDVCKSYAMTDSTL